MMVLKARRGHRELLSMCGWLGVPEERLRKVIGKYAASAVVETTAYWRYQCHETTMWESSVCGTRLSESSRQAAQAAMEELEKGGGPGFL